MDTDNVYKYFEKALNKWIQKTGRGYQKILAISCDCKRSYISQLLSSKRQKPIPFEFQIKIAAACGYNYLEFLQHGKKLHEGIQDTKKNIIKFDTKTEKEHFEVTKKFIHKKEAINFNRFLVTIDKYDYQTFRELYKEAEMADKMIKRHVIGKKTDIKEDSNQAASGEE